LHHFFEAQVRSWLSATGNVFEQRTCPSKKRGRLPYIKNSKSFFNSIFNLLATFKAIDMNELLEKRAEITIKLNNATQKLADEGNGFIDKKYFVEVSKWNQELEKIQAEIEKLME
jgi:thymidylate synthase